MAFKPHNTNFPEPFDKVFNFETFPLRFTLLLLLVIFTMGVYRVFNNPHFIKEFRGKSTYEPLNTDSSGAVGRINHLLKLALLDTNSSVKLKDDLSNINKFYRRIQFNLDSNTSDKVLKHSDLKLITYIPKNRADSTYFFNSPFRILLEKQNKSLSKSYFNIKLSSQRKKKIESISVDSMELHVQLQKNTWNGNIIVSNPYKSIDENSILLIEGSYFFPILEKSNASSLKELFVKDLNGWKFINNQITKKGIFMYNENGKIIMIKNNDDSLTINRYDKNWFEIREELPNKFKDPKEPNKFIIPKEVLTENQYRVTLIRGNKEKLEFTLWDANSITIGAPCNNGTVGDRNSINDRYLDLSTKQKIRILGQSFVKSDKENLYITENILLGKMLEERILNFYREKFRDYRNRIIEISVCVMDIYTGRILATPYFSNQWNQYDFKETFPTEKNFNLYNHDIASTFKPLFAGHCVQKKPSLLNFSFEDYSPPQHNNKTCEILEYEVESYPRKNVKDPLFWSNCTSMSEFLGKSHDNYPIALFLKSVKPNIKQLKSTPWVTFEQLDTLPFFIDMAKNYGVELNYTKSSVICNNYWKDTKLKIPYQLKPDKVNLMGPAKEKKYFYDIKAFVLGQGDNKWSNVALAQGYARLISGREIQGTFIFSQPKNRPNEIAGNNRTTRVQFLERWERAVNINNATIREPYNLFKNGVTNPGEYKYYAKTGTPEDLNRNSEYFKPTIIDEGLFAVGIVASNNNEKGIVCVVHVRSNRLPGNNSIINSEKAKILLNSETYKKITQICQSSFR